MQSRNVFNYLSARRYLVDFVEAKKKAERTFSVRKWSKEMGMSTHTLLVMVLQGKRSLTLKQVPYLARGMKLSTPEQLYFQCLVQYENAKTDEERKLIRLWMAEANPGQGTQIREIDEFLMISHWVHMAILSMTSLKRPATLELITESLRDRVSPAEIQAAVERLVSLKLLKVNGARYESTFARVTTKDDVASKGAREYYRQVSALAADAIERVPLDRREFQGFALSVPLDRIPLAKEMIRKFRTQFCEAMKGAGDEVFQMNIQFFQLTECPSEMVPTVDEGAERESRSARANASNVGEIQ